MNKPTPDQIIEAAITVANTDRVQFAEDDRGRGMWARRLAAAAMADEWNMSTPEIAEAVGVCSHSGIVVWLRHWRTMPSCMRAAACAEMWREIDRLRGG